jgi:hypothetical protein
MNRARLVATSRKVMHGLAMLVGMWIVFGAAQYDEPSGLRTISLMVVSATGLYAIPLVVSWMGLFFHVRAAWFVWVLAVGIWTYQNGRLDSASRPRPAPRVEVAPQGVATIPLQPGYLPGPPPPPPPPAWRRFTTQDGRYSLELPEDWVILSAQDAVFVAVGKLQSTPASCRFRDSTPAPAPMTRQAIEAMLRKSVPDLRIYKVGSKPLAGGSAKRVFWGGTRDGAINLGAEYVRTFAGQSSRGLALTCSTKPRDHIDDALESFDRMAASLYLSD